ncbi:hypothetical protein H5410_021834 [Solanum commersonii]|uniref:Reverse transcriptase n=1 Tax=Solanum commersonii TaxID=4109 RepID=A0A9J5ZCH2_SOLCO|nr:hypothetical protein H5410_021834 [Solanum commersonii]
MAHAELKVYLHFEEKFWRQKASVRWFEEGVRNIKLFHSLVRGRRKRFYIRRIIKSDGSWVGSESVIVENGVNFYTKQFTAGVNHSDLSLLMHINHVISQKENDILTKLPDEDEIKRVVFELNAESSYGPDGFSGCFYQNCWDTIDLDVIKLLTRALNHPFLEDEYRGYGFPKWRELINKEKSFFYLFNKVSLSFVQMLEEITSFWKGSFPLTYLGCPIGQKNIHFKELTKKIQNKLQMWKGKLLSYGGKEVLINHVLQSIHVYLLSAIRPPKCVIDDIHMIFAKFLWDSKEQGRATYWVEWGTIVYSRRREA